MNWTMSNPRAALLAASLTAVLLSLPQVCLAAGRAQSSSATAQAQGDNPAAVAAAARLDKKQYAAVKVSVDNGIATLTGTVDLYEYKADAQKRVQKAKGVIAVRNLIEVAGPTVPDQELEAKLVKSLAWDRVGYGNLFDAITVSVKNGVVTVGGHARIYEDRDSALALIATYPGVKDIDGEIEVDPTSIMDDRIRMAVAQAVYGYTSLNKYAIDPAKPIRISVQNGHVELYGVVDSQSDKDTAFIRANGVSGVFSVKNYLQVAGQPTEAEK
ncbi:MAG: BON domain-containing protein [Terracidiphilus sp.]|jgi:osmotically-inducible protein OsmY